MSNEKPDLKPQERFLPWLPWLILVCGLVLTGLQASALHRQALDLAEAEFEIRASELATGLEQRMVSHAQILRGVAGLFASSDEVTREEFRRYVEGLQLAAHYPGIQGLGYVQLVPAKEKAAHIAAIRAQGFPSYDIRPAGARPLYSAVVYVEPFNWRNQRALGFDMFTEPVRTKAAYQACDAGQPVISDKVTLVQETTQDVQAGFLIFMPIYHQGSAPASPEERRAALLGWAYSPLRAKDLLDSYLQHEYPKLSGLLALRLYAGNQTQAASLLYDSYPPAGSVPWELVRTLQLPGATWTLTLAPLPAYWDGEQVDTSSQLMLVAGLLITLLLAFIAYVRGRRHLETAAALRETTRAHHALAEQEALLRAIYDTSGVAILLVDTTGKIIHANQHAAELFQCPHSDLLGSDYYQLTPPGEREIRRRQFGQLFTGEDTSLTLERSFWHKNSSAEFWGRLTARFFHDAADAIRGVVVVIEDITERRQHEAAMRLASTVLTASPGGILVTDAQRRIISVNPAFSRITGYAPEEVFGQKPSILAAGRQSSQFYREMWQSIDRTGHWEGELLNRRKNGELFPEVLSISRVLDETGAIVNYVGMFLDITERRKAEERIWHLAHHDYLTGLPNRALLVERAIQALALARRYQRRMAIIFIDLDRFKPINDEYGHDAGDAVLRAVAGRLQALVRKSDTVCRQGGDEFVILLPEINDLADLEELAKKLLAAIQEPCAVEGNFLSVSASIGIATYPEHGDTVDTIIQRADSAMYRAKADPKKHICFAR